MFGDITFTVGSIFNGIQPSSIFGQAGQYLMGLGIDPDVPASDENDDLRTAGIIRPVNYEQFSSNAIDSAPIAIITTPKTPDTVFVVLSSGRVVTYDSNLDNETNAYQVQESGSPVAARGAWYNSNYIYITTPHDVSRLGPLDGTIVMEDEFWSGTLGKTNLEDSDYPQTLFNIGYLNHFGISHLDGASYFLDFKDGVGYVHMINTEKGTAQGDTDSSVRPSAYAILDLPFDYVPVTIGPYGEDLCVGASFTTSTDITQGPAALFFFKPADTLPSFYRKVPLPGVLCSVIKYDNGVLYGICGDIAGGYILFQYVGGDTVQTLKIIEDGVPPLQAACDYVANRMVWAANTQVPVVTSGLYGYGSKSDLFPRGLHHIAISGFQ